MKQYVKVFFLIILGLALFIPLASNFPDGLESVAEALRIEIGEPLWHGVMPDYSTSLIDDSYISTFISGAFGTLLVLAVAFIVGAAVTRKNVS